ncbi:alpha/beta hydrolase [Desulfonema ishimotonii]|uniref:Alpha/beta hydrolase n=1 Tax=Desulfonema ishimotonii TaxID=45657 RepID=A0A401FXL1_9BACT|nr:alpha/beta hydrolase [Desulfonema ishimotonii]GBC61695.1 alpha/beta hydrolase [Desulfonema ishimotonii]
MHPYIDYLTTFDRRILRYGIWRCNRHIRQGSVILTSGRSEFMEKYLETIADLNQRGFDVYSFDWRGQGLSSRLLANRHKGFVHAYDDYVRDLAFFMDEVVRLAAWPRILMGHSMGGHIILRYLHDCPRAVRQAILISPMIDVNTAPFPRPVARFLTRQALRDGRQYAYATGYGDYRHPDEKSFRRNKLTSDFRRFMIERDAVEKNPNLALGGVTYGWLAATFDSVEILRQPGYGARIQTPVLMVSAGNDRVVSACAQKKFCLDLPRGRRVEIPGACHEILQETDDIRSIFWRVFDQFTRKNA